MPQNSGSLVNQRHFREAHEAAVRYAQHHPSNAEAWQKAVLTALLMGDQPTAVSMYRNMRGCEDLATPMICHVQRDFALYYIRRRMHEQARRCISRARKWQGNDANLASSLDMAEARLCASEGDLARARQLLERTVPHMTDPQWQHNRDIALLYVLRRLGDAKAAEKLTAKIMHTPLPGAKKRTGEAVVINLPIIGPLAYKTGMRVMALIR